MPWKRVRIAKKAKRRRIHINRAALYSTGDLEQETERLKREYGADWHSRIEDNLKWVVQEMRASPASIAIQEGIIALSHGLPVRRGPDRKKSGANKRFGGK